MQRICTSLSKFYEVELIGRNIDQSILSDQSFQQTRLNCWFRKGKMFYLEYNLRIFLYLVFSKSNVIGAIDTDTLLGCYLAAKIRKVKLVLDAHEYYSEVIELADRPISKKIWKWLEKTLIPKVDAAYTVSAGLQQLMTKEFGKPFELVRNMSNLTQSIDRKPVEHFQYMVYAGAVNEGRGIKQMLEAMSSIEIPLYILGDGDLFEQMKNYSHILGLEHKVFFVGNVTPTILNSYIKHAYIGFLLLENKGISYFYSLANKYFDYIHGETPQITINFPEYQILMKDYQVGLLVDLEVNQILKAVNKLLTDTDFYHLCVEQCRLAKYEYNWQSEELKLLRIYQQIIK
jgi:glycosyltransferase involved in cell wall biosynthesis